MEAIVQFFKVLSDSNRLKILKMLQMRTLCVCEMTEVLQLAASTVSNHLKILKETGFIIEEKQGKWVNYLINPEPADPRVTAFLNRLDFWIGNNQELLNEIEGAKRVDRKFICC